MTTTEETTDKPVKLRELPVTVNVSKMAEGLLEMFTEEERTVLRFGMLPAKKMEILEKNLRQKFEELGRHPRDVWPLSTIAQNEYSEDDRVSTVNGEIREWNIHKLVAEAMHEICLGIYAIGDLVV
jgi:hypothetical protein